ncbi:hypothetical protein ES703_63992 [subsurface metagenome]
MLERDDNVVLRLYWRIVRRRLWLVVSLLAIVLLSYFLFRPAEPTRYTANMRLVVGLRPEARAGSYYTYDRYYTWLTAEYLLDDFAEVVKSEVFAQDVAALAGVDVPTGAIHGATSTGKLHRILSVTITWPDREELEGIADAVVQVVRDQGNAYFAQLATDSATISVIDPPSIHKVRPTLRQRLDLPLRLLLGLGVGVGLAFLLDYTDDTIRHREDLEKLALPILGEIPRRRKWLAGLFRRRSRP